MFRAEVCFVYHYRPVFLNIFCYNQCPFKKSSQPEDFHSSTCCITADRGCGMPGANSLVSMVCYLQQKVVENWSTGQGHHSNSINKCLNLLIDVHWYSYRRWGKGNYIIILHLLISWQFWCVFSAHLQKYLLHLLMSSPLILISSLDNKKYHETNYHSDYYRNKPLELILYRDNGCNADLIPLKELAWQQWIFVNATLVFACHTQAIIVSRLQWKVLIYAPHNNVIKNIETLYVLGPHRGKRRNT